MSPCSRPKPTSEIVDWVRALGLTELLNDLPERDQHAWEIESDEARFGAADPVAHSGSEA